MKRTIEIDLQFTVEVEEPATVEAMKEAVLRGTFDWLNSPAIVAKLHGFAEPVHGS